MLGEQREGAEDCGRHGWKTIIARSANVRAAPMVGKYRPRVLP